jgi:hypothetical protein
MDMILRVGDHSWNLGQRHIVDSFFDTVACRLEPNGRASRFPRVSDDLKSGRLTAAHATAALHELDLIDAELRAVPTSKIIWAGSQPDPNGAANAWERLVAPDGRPLIAYLRSGVEQCASTGKTLRCYSPGRVRQAVWVLVCAFLAGIAWLLFGYLLIPNWLVSPLVWSGARPTGIPVWSFGFLVSVSALFGLIHQAIPAVGIWFERRSWVGLVLFLLEIAVWIALFDVS